MVGELDAVEAVRWWRDVMSLAHWLARTFLATAPEDRSGEDRTLVVVHVAADQLIDEPAADVVPAGTSPTSGTRDGVWTT